MLTLEEFDSLEVGDQIETIPLLPALCADPVILRTVVVTAEKREFVATYCGITVARWECRKGGEGLKWSV